VSVLTVGKYVVNKGGDVVILYAHQGLSAAKLSRFHVDGS
jgi:hypothetical protein